MRVVILGGGESGVGAAYLAKAKGFEVFLSDMGTIRENYKKELDLFRIITVRFCRSFRETKFILCC